MEKIASIDLAPISAWFIPILLLIRQTAAFDRRLELAKAEASPNVHLIASFI